MTKKTRQKISSEFSIKASISNEVELALQQIETILDRARSDVVRSALYEYIKEHYPEFLRKSKEQIMTEIKEKADYEIFKQEFINTNYIKKIRINDFL